MRQSALAQSNNVGSADPAIQTSSGDIGTVANEQTVFVQNLGTSPLFIRKGTGASATVFHVCIGGGTADDDGTGGTAFINDWIGVISVYSSAPRFVSHISQ